MKLRLRVMQMPADGSHVLVLCDEGGDPLPRQRNLAVTQEWEEVPTVTVTFVVDGDDVAYYEGSRKP